MTIKVTVEKSKGYERGMGKLAQKSWVAEITGLTATDFERTFPERDDVDWGDSKLYKSSKGTWTEIFNLGPGIYEICQYGDRTYRLVYDRGDKLVYRTVPADVIKTALAICDDPYTLIETFAKLARTAFAATGSTNTITLKQAAETTKEM